MTINEAIIQALAPFGDPVTAGIYTGEAKRYYTFNYDLLPKQFADNRPLFERVLIQVHFIAPLAFNSVRRRNETRKALIAAGLSWPTTTDASDRDSQHFVFECETIIDAERNDDE